MFFNMLIKEIYFIFCLINTCISVERLLNYENLYQLGMDAYKSEKYTECSSYFEKAIEDFHQFQNGLIDCRLKCRRNSTDVEFKSYELVFNDLLVNSRCLRHCKKKKFGTRAEEEISTVTDKKFEDRTPYNYLQFCYFKDEQFKKAASAAYTFYITHQGDKRIIENLHYYKNLEGVEDDDFVDLERKPYQISYIKGVEAYGSSKWEKATAHLEESLSLYFKEEQRCRAGCEKGFHHNGFPDFFNAIGDHYVMVIVCQQRCLMRLSTFGMKELENFVSEHYNYLQYAYFESGNMKKAMESIASYLLFKPTDQDMLHNKDFYINNMKLKEEDFVPSQDALQYIKLWQQIERSLDFVREDYLLPNDVVDDENDEPDKKDSKFTQDTIRKNTLHIPERMKAFEKAGVVMFADSKQLKGNNRFVANELIREDQCQSLADLAMEQEPDENGIKKISMGEIIESVNEDPDFEISLRLLLRAIDYMAMFSSVYVRQPLVTKDVQVVCRAGSSLPEMPVSESCILQEDGACGETAANIHYMTVAYLTDVSDGTGHTYFVDGTGSIQSKVEPKCGRLLGFPGSDRYGVNTSLKQERCVIVTQLSHDSEHLLKDVQKSRDLLASIEESRLKNWSTEGNADILKEFYDQGVRIVKKDTDLLGNERFVAEGLTTSEECEELIKLAKMKGLSGDGYQGNVTPHTKRELFTGLEIARLEQLVKQAAVPVRSLQLFLEVSELGRLLSERYLNLTKPLYFDYTHLVCRTAIQVPGEESSDDLDLSHPVHSDNCMIQPDGSCVADEQAFKQRHYSAILYLNDDFEGGQFFFAHNNKSEQVSLDPKCGRLVAFNAGEYHGVKSVKKGQRCAIAMWFTHDPDYKEVSRVHAQRTLSKMNFGAGQSHSKDEVMPPEPFLDSVEQEEAGSRDEL